MTEKKITQKEALTYVVENCVIPTHIEDKINSMIAQLEKKAVKSGTSKTQQANDGLRAVILEEMEKDRLYTVTELCKEISALAEYKDGNGNGISNQKASALVSGLVKAGKLDRIVSKGRSYFKLLG